MLKQQIDANYTPSPDLKAADISLCHNLWPVTIAVGLLAEFYSQLLKTYTVSQEQAKYIQTYLDHEISKNDFVTQSVEEVYAVKTGKRSLESFLNEYGLRADQDYEFAMPRWSENLTHIKAIIERSVPSEKSKIELQITSPQVQKIIHTIVELQKLRSDTRKSMLPAIYTIRQAAINKYGQNCDFNTFTRESLLENKEPEATYDTKIQIQKIKYNKEGIGMPISQGTVTAPVLHISQSTQEIPAQTIIICPNASPEFSMQYARAAGILFVVGGMTSHGAIVAREYNIPAISDINAESISDGTIVTMDGSTGKWTIQ
jgi:phosphohistidine swiveling domain-containing protein